MVLEELLLGKVFDILEPFIQNIITAAGTRRASQQEAERLASKELFRGYYEAAIRRCAVVKSILYRTAAVNLYDFYVDLDVIASAEGHRYEFGDLHTFFAKYRTSVITGGAGSGKSTLLKHLFLQSIDQHVGLPVLCELRDLADSNTSLEDFLLSSLRERNLDVSSDQLQSLLRGGLLILFFDGFDELPDSRSDLVARELNALVIRYPALLIIVTSRPDAQRFIGWHGFPELEIAPLSIDRCLALIDKLHYDVAIKDRFSEAIRGGLYESHRSFLENPLLTTLMLMTFEQFGAIEKRMHLFYAQAFDTLFQKHDATKLGFRREMHCALDAESFRAVLSAFSIQSYWKSEIRFTPGTALNYLSHCSSLLGRRISLSTADFLRDLTSALCLLLDDGLHLTFAHRSFQEYFAALFILHHAHTRRPAMLAGLRSRLTTDSTAALICDMDPITFEREFLDSQLSELRECVGWQPQADIKKLYLTFVRRHLRITIQHGELEVAFSAIGRQASHLIEFLARAYFEQPFAWFESAETLAQSFVKYTRPEILSPDIGSRKERRLVQTDSLYVAEEVFDTLAFQEFFLRVSAPGLQAFRNALRLPEQLASRRASNEHSIDRLLLLSGSS